MFRTRDSLGWSQIVRVLTRKILLGKGVIKSELVEDAGFIVRRLLLNTISRFSHGCTRKTLTKDVMSSVTKIVKKGSLDVATGAAWRKVELVVNQVDSSPQRICRTHQHVMQVADRVTVLVWRPAQACARQGRTCVSYRHLVGHERW